MQKKNTNEKKLYEGSPVMFKSRPIYFLFCTIMNLLFFIVILGFIYEFFVVEEIQFLEGTYLYSLPVLIPCFYSFSRWYLLTRTTKLTITDDRVLFQTGILLKSYKELKSKNIEKVEVVNGFLQRLFNTGNIYIATAGTSGEEISAQGFLSPRKIADIINISINIADSNLYKNENKILVVDDSESFFKHLDSQSDNKEYIDIKENSNGNAIIKKNDDNN